MSKSVSDLYLEYQVVQGWLEKTRGGFIDMSKRQTYVDRMVRELDIFSQAGISDYFLILKGILDWCYDQNIPVGPGRGSAAGCLTSYLIGITLVDPLEYGLLLERFYNPGRLETRELPDIDVDVSQEHRDRIINDYIIPTYGANRVSPIVAYGTMQPKACLKDIGRALDIHSGETELMSQLIMVKRGNPMSIKDTLKDTQINEDEEEELTYPARKLREYKSRYPELFKWAELIEDHEIVRTKSVHAAGIIIAPEPVGNIIPVDWNASKKLACTAYDMHTDPSGLLKLDLLGLRNTDVIHDTMKRLGITEKYRDYLMKVPMDDELVFMQLSRGNAKGVFQFESHFMRSILVDVQPENIEDLSIINALGRPGPLDAQIDVTDDIIYLDDMESEDGFHPFLKKKRKSFKNTERITLNMIEVYAARKAGAIRVTYLHPKLEPILGITLGVMVYQEQVMRIATDLAGYTLAEADGLRKAVGKKIAEKMAANETKFIEGCVNNNINESIARAIWDQIKTFAGYGFNKSHSISYSILAYWTAYFKYRHPAEFMASLISSDRDIEKRSVWLEDARETLGLKIEPPDINKSQRDFSSSGSTLLFGLSEIKGVGAKAVNHILAVRASGPFKGIKDFYARLDLGVVDAGVMNAIIASGAFLRYDLNKPTLKEWDAKIRDRRGKAKGVGDRRSNLITKLEAQIAARDASAMPKKFKGNVDAYIASLSEKLEKARLELGEAGNIDALFKDLDYMPDITLDASLKMEEEVLGLGVSASIATPYTNLIKMYGIHSTADCKEDGGPQRGNVCGVLTDLRTHTIKSGKYKGQDMMYAKLTDLEGSINLLIFPNNLDKFRHLIMPGKLVRVRVNKMDDGLTFGVSGIEDVQEVYKEQLADANA